jgi:hypothetical protein
MIQDAPTLQAPACLSEAEQLAWWRRHAQRWRFCARERRHDAWGMQESARAAHEQNVRLQRRLEQLEQQIVGHQSEINVLHDENEALWTLIEERKAAS